MRNDMRVAVTKRMLKEGLLRCIKDTPLSSITVSDLCRESGINRATFYNHYDSPRAILKEIAWDYSNKLEQLFQESLHLPQSSYHAAAEKCCQFVFDERDNLRILLSEGVGSEIRQIVFEVVFEALNRPGSVNRGPSDDPDLVFLYNHATASAIFTLLRIWICNDIPKSPSEIAVLIGAIGRSLLKNAIDQTE